MPPVQSGPVAPDEDRTRTKTRLKAEAPPDTAVPVSTPQRVGRYEVLEVIGKGAMGVVYKARDPLLDRVVAIKTIYAPASLGSKVRNAYFERFDREAKAAARLAHPAIVTIFDVGFDADAPFLVMEYLPGETLADVLDRERIPLAQAVQCARDLASALGMAHRERIVHRDVKPANVLHAGETRWKLADFGIARLPDSDLTQVGIFMGTPGYAPPEAIREGSYTVQADVFAWGAVLYELICGRIPYEGPDTRTTNGYVLRGEPPSPRVYDSSLPEPLAEVALRALAHDTRKRYKDCSEAEKALAQAWDRSLAKGLVPMTAFSTQSRPPDSTPVPPPRPPAPPPMPPAAGKGKRDASTPTVPGKRGPAMSPDFRSDVPTVVDPNAEQKAIDRGAAFSPRRPPVEQSPPGPPRSSPRLRNPAPTAAPTQPRQAVQPPPVGDTGKLQAAAALARAQQARPQMQGGTATSGSRLWVTVSLILLLAVVAGIAAFYYLRGS